MVKIHMQKTSGFSPSTLLVKNSILNLLGMVLPLLVGIIAIPFAIKGLGKEGFGILAIAWVVLGYFALFDFGLSRATTKFVSEMLGKGGIESLPSIIWTAVIVSFGLGILAALILFFLTPFFVETLLKIPRGFVHQAKLSFYILAFSVPIILCSTSLRGVLEAAQRFDLVNLIIIPTSMLSFIFPGLSFPFHLNLSTVVFLIALSRLAAALAYLSFCFRVFPIIRTKAAVNLNQLKRMLSYGGWISITNIISPLLVYMDRFFIGSMISMASVAFYTAPYEGITRLRIFATAIMQTLFPEFSALSVDADNSDRLEMLFVRAIKSVLISVGILIISLFFSAPLLLQTWLGPEFEEQSLSVFRILAIGVLINCIAIIPYNLLQGIGRPDLPAKFHFLEFPIYLFLLWVLIPNFGIDGAALAWTIRVGLDASLLFWVVLKTYPLMIQKIRASNIGRSLLLFLFSFVLLLSLDMVLSDMIYKLFLLISLLLSLALLTWYFILDDTERHMTHTLCFKLIKCMKFSKGQ